MLWSTLRKYGESWYHSLTRHRWRRYLGLFEESGGTVLGCGCATGELSRKVAQKVGAHRLIGIDLNQAALVVSVGTPLLPLLADLNEPFPLADESIGVVSADQVIEHLYNTDNFVRELRRVLRPGGYAVVCTENLSAWHNLAALAMSFQAFSQAISGETSVGNPLSVHHGERCEMPGGDRHIHIFTPRGLREIFEVCGFQIERFAGIGHLPLLPITVSAMLERLDAWHAYFIAVKARKV